MWSDLEAWLELYWGCGNTGGSCGCYCPGMPDGLVAIAVPETSLAALLAVSTLSIYLAQKKKA